MEKKYDEVNAVLSDSSMILVGLGEGFNPSAELENNTHYAEVCQKIAELGMQWMLPYVNYYFLKDNTKLKKAYDNLAKLLAGKNYFVISTACDGLVRQHGMKDKLIVEPCGTVNKTQCADVCDSVVLGVNEELNESIRKCIEGELAFEEFTSPVCGNCGKAIQYNSLYSEKYNEAGYMEDWNFYTLWLQTTLNRNLCILELGSDLMLGSVLRFRFEKIAALNQKSKLIRVHESLCMLPEGIRDRGISISENPLEFMAEWEVLC